jgi:hypothetical protein
MRGEIRIEKAYANLTRFVARKLRRARMQCMRRDCVIAGDEGLDPGWDGAFIRIAHWHFHSQLLSRYGIILGPGEFSRIVKAIKTGEALLIERRSAKQALYSVRIKSAKERIYILAEGPNIITAWPPHKRLNELRRKLTARQRVGGAAPG